MHKERIAPGTLTLHADRGTSMRSKPVAALLVDLDVIKMHSRPHVSDDNPFSEAQFKTLKYRPDYPARFASIEHARAYCRAFFRWYNTVHIHSGIAMLTRHTVHRGHDQRLTEERGITNDGSLHRPPAALQRPRTNAESGTKIRLDQSIHRGNRKTRNHHLWSVKYFVLRVSKSLTCSTRTAFRLGGQTMIDPIANRV